MGSSLHSHQQQNDFHFVNLANPLTHFTLTPESLGPESLLPPITHRTITKTKREDYKMNWGRWKKNEWDRRISGKVHNKGMRAHKLTLQVLWRLLVSTFLSFVAEADNKCHAELSTIVADDKPEQISELVSFLMQERFCKLVTDAQAVIHRRRPFQANHWIQ